MVLVVKLRRGATDANVFLFGATPVVVQGGPENLGEIASIVLNFTLRRYPGHYPGWSSFEEIYSTNVRISVL